VAGVQGIALHESGMMNEEFKKSLKKTVGFQPQFLISNS
jgi:hypothetical protein